MLPFRILMPLWALTACGLSEAPAPNEPQLPSLALCAVAGEGALDATPLAWVDGSTPAYAVWRTASHWVHDGGQVERATGAARAWVVHDELWVASGAELQRHPLAGGDARPLDVASLGGLEGEGQSIADVAVVTVAGQVSGVWVAVVGGEVSPESWLLHLMPGATSATWSVVARYPTGAGIPVRYVEVAGGPSRAAVAYEAGDARGVEVVSRRGKPLRNVALPAAAEGSERVALGLVGQGVLTVLADGRVLLDRPGHRHVDRLEHLQQVSLGGEGLIAVGSDGRMQAWVRRGVGLVEGLRVPGRAVAASTLGEGVVVVLGGDEPSSDPSLVVVRGPIQPVASGPSWAPEVAAPHRCAAPSGGQLLLPPLLGLDGAVRLVLQPISLEGEPPPSPRWVNLPPPVRGPPVGR